MSDLGAKDSGTMDAGTADTGTSEGDARDTATDAGQQDATEPLCDCASDEVSLACVCAQTSSACYTFEQALASVNCRGGPGIPSLQQGCGYKRVNSSGSGGAQNFVYQGAANTLVGAFLYIDVPFGTCSRATYGTQMPELETCADYSICDLCPNGAIPCQP